jgi:hypothetical protein
MDESELRVSGKMFFSTGMAKADNSWREEVTHFYWELFSRILAFTNPAYKYSNIYICEYLYVAKP